MPPSKIKSVSLGEAKMRKKLITVTLIAIGVSGCTMTYFQKFDPQSHYGYPNSNVTPLSHVKGQATKTAFFTLPMITSSLQHDAIYNALQQAKGADLLVNTFHFMDITNLVILPIYTITYRVEGTAAKMEVGTTPQR